MKKTNKAEYIKWFISILFANIGQKYLFNLFDFKYNPFIDSFDIIKSMIDLGVFIALILFALFVLGCFKK